MLIHQLPNTRTVYCTSDTIHIASLTLVTGIHACGNARTRVYACVCMCVHACTLYVVCEHKCGITVKSGYLNHPRLLSVTLVLMDGKFHD